MIKPLRIVTLLVGAVLVGAVAATASAADNQLTEKEKAAGWQLLFNGRDHTGWRCNNGKEIATPVEDGALVPYKSGGRVIVHEDQFADFILKCDVRWEAERCNSGIFFRIEDLGNPVHTGFEIQVLSGTETGYHHLGSIYDMAATTKNTGHDTGEWNSVEIHCKGPLINVLVNGEQVCSADCDQFDKPGLTLEGKPHKFKLDGEPRAVKDFARVGYVGFQDHGQKVWYKNVKLLELD